MGGLPPEPKEVGTQHLDLRKIVTTKFYCVCVCVQEEPEPVQPKPGRKWEVVNASYYGRGGAGGIRPVTVSMGIQHNIHALYLCMYVPLPLPLFNQCFRCGGVKVEQQKKETNSPKQRQEHQHTNVNLSIAVLLFGWLADIDSSIVW